MDIINVLWYTWPNLFMFYRILFLRHACLFTGRFIVWPCPSDIDHETSCAWWRHQMESYSALLAICVGNSPGTGVANQIPIIHMGRSRRLDCLVVWFCYQLMARLDGRMVAPSWPGQCEISQNLVIYSHKMNSHLCMYKVLHEPVCICVLFYPSSYLCSI